MSRDPLDDVADCGMASYGPSNAPPSVPRSPSVWRAIKRFASAAAQRERASYNGIC